MNAMFQLADCLNVPLSCSQSESTAVRRNSDAGYSSNESDLSSPETSNNPCSSNTAIPGIEYVAGNNPNPMFCVADEIFSEIQNQNLTPASNDLSANFYGQRKTTEAETYATIKVIPTPSADLSADPLHAENSALKYAYINGEKVAIKIVSHPNLDTTDCYHISQNTLNYVCNSRQADKSLTVSPLSPEEQSPLHQEGASVSSPQQYSVYPGDIDFLENLAVEDRSLNDLVTICNQPLAESKPQEDELCASTSSTNSPEAEDSNSFLDKSGLMNTSNLMLPFLSQKNSDSIKFDSPLEGDDMQKLLSDSNRNCTARELDAGQVSPSPCLDDDPEPKNFQSR